MKKILVMVAILALTATSSFAQVTSPTGTLSFTTTGTTLTADPATAKADTAQIGRMSTGVDVGWITEVNGYSLMTQHKAGTKAYGSSYDSTALYSTTSTSIDPGTPAYAVGVLNATDTANFSGTDWKAM
jgi:hypothetical protein